MQKGDTVILNRDYEDLIAGTMGVVVSMVDWELTIEFETGQIIDFDTHFVEPLDWFEVVE